MATIISILITLSLDFVFVVLEENWFWSLLRTPRVVELLCDKNDVVLVPPGLKFLELCL